MEKNHLVEIQSKLNNFSANLQKEHSDLADELRLLIEIRTTESNTREASKYSAEIQKAEDRALDNMEIRLQKALMASEDKYQSRESINKSYMDNQLRELFLHCLRMILVIGIGRLWF